MADNEGEASYLERSRQLISTIKHNLKIRESKDLPDIIDLIRINKIDFKGKEFKELCLKYGTEEIYRKIVERM